MVQLKYVVVSEIRRVLETIARRGGIVRTDDARNLITLSGSRQDIASLMDAISLFDIDTMKGVVRAGAGQDLAARGDRRRIEIGVRLRPRRADGLSDLVAGTAHVRNVQDRLCVSKCGQPDGLRARRFAPGHPARTRASRCRQVRCVVMDWVMME